MRLRGKHRKKALTDLPKSQLHTYKSVPLPAFMEYYLNGDPSGIVVSGNPTQSELEAAGLELRTYFDDAMADTDRMLQVAPLEANARDLWLYKEVLNLCKEFPHPKAFELLRDLGFPYPMDEYDEDQISIVENMIASKEMNQKRSIDNFHETAKAGDPINEEWFYSTCIHFADMHNGGAVYSPQQFTLLQFILKYREYLKWGKMMTAQLEKSKQ